jgi:hypothetical protein
METTVRRVPQYANKYLSDIYQYIDVPKTKEEKEEELKLTVVKEPEVKEKITIETFIEKYKNDPELRKVPLPDYFYDKYNIPRPEILGLNSYLFKSIKSCMSGGWNSETRQADEKGIRKMPFLSTVEGLDLSGNPTTFMSTFTD